MSAPGPVASIVRCALVTLAGMPVVALKVRFGPDRTPNTGLRGLGYWSFRPAFLQPRRGWPRSGAKPTLCELDCGEPADRLLMLGVSILDAPCNDGIIRRFPMATV
jgi:hypothetical protein